MKVHFQQLQNKIAEYIRKKCLQSRLFQKPGAEPWFWNRSREVYMSIYLDVSVCIRVKISHVLSILNILEFRCGNRNAKILKTFKLRQNCKRSHILPKCIIFHSLTGATWYNHANYLVFTLVSSYTGYEEEIFLVFC